MIREATFDDDGQINRLGKLLKEDYDKLFILDKIISDKYAKLFVYESDNKIIGFIHVNELEETIDLINIVVDPNYRRNKIGSLLLTYIIGEAKKTVKTITLEVSANNIAAQKLYEKHDFEILNVRLKYYGKEDGLSMGRRME